MPNWCSASYAIEGDAEEVKSLYKLMKRLQEQKEPSVPIRLNGKPLRQACQAV